MISKNNHRANTARLFMLTILLLTACSQGDDRPKINITIGAPQSTLSSLIWLTDDFAYFEEQGINMTLKTYPSGKRALAAMMRGEVDLAATAETPFVIALFKRDDLQLYATMGQSDNEVRLLARRDHGINEPSDLKGKTIGTQKGSAVHFFLSSFLLEHQLPPDEINVVFMKAEKLPEALANGEIDAFSMRDPILAIAKKTIGKDKLIEFSEPGLYTKTYNLVGSTRSNKKYPDAIEGVLRAMHKAENFISANQQHAIEKIATKLSLPITRVNALWPDLRIRLNLNQALITTLEEEIRWAVNSGQAKLINGKTPNIMSHIDSIPLQAAIPDSIGIIGIKQRAAD